MMLGDDNIMLMTHAPNLTGFKRYVEENFNMQTKLMVSKKVGSFIRLIVYTRGDGLVSMGPDIIRLKYRFEVTNGASECTNELL